MQVLMQPRNALGRQFAYQFELSGTRLHITEGAQLAIAALVIFTSRSSLFYVFSHWSLGL